jgi:hypothetical protein
MLPVQCGKFVARRLQIGYEPPTRGSNRLNDPLESSRHGGSGQFTICDGYIHPLPNVRKCTP